MSRRGAIGQLIAVSRPLSWVNTAYPFAAAAIMSGGAINATLAFGTLFFLIPYNLLMYGVNDVFDHASDAANPRKGGVEGALAPVASHRGILVVAGALTLVFAVPLIVAGSPLATTILILLLIDVVGYSAPPLRLKERPIVDSISSSVHFVGPAVYAIALVGAPWTATVWTVLAAFFAWGVASHAFGAVQDIVPDRAAGIGSVATALGARWTVRFALVLWTSSAVAMLTIPWPGNLAAALAIPYLWLAWPYRSLSDTDSAAANGGWRRFLWVNYAAGFAVTMILIAVARS